MKKAEKDQANKIEAYNAWRTAEEKRGKAQDEHGRNLVKTMLERVKAFPPKEPATESMCYVMGNVDGKSYSCVLIKASLSFFVHGRFFFGGYQIEALFYICKFYYNLNVLLYVYDL